MRIHYKLSLIILPLSIVLNCKSQDWNTIFTLETDAEYYMADGNYGKAAETYLKALKKYPESANLMFKAGYCYLKTDDQKKEALYYLEEAAQKVSDRYDSKALKEPNSPPEVLFSLGVAYMLEMNFDKATAAFTEYKKYVKPKDVELNYLVDQHITSCSLAKSAVQNPVGLKTKNLGELINTDQSNFNAVISGDGKTLAYTTRIPTGNKIFISKNENGEWSKPVDISRYLGSKFLKTSFLAYEGQELYLIEEDPVNSEIVVSFLQKNKWSKPVKAAKPINSKYNEDHVCVTRDGNTVYFTSDRKGGQGGFDIYKTTIEGDGWSEPVNLGPNVNTPLNEDTPFLTPDEKYMFFSSEGHSSIGGYDIFYVNLAGMSKVYNIGYPLNTPDNNLFYQPTGLNSGYYSYYNNDGIGGLDIYSVEIIPFVNLKINIMLAENAPGNKNYRCIITDENSNKIIDSIGGNGSQLINKKLMPGKYAVKVSGNGFELAQNIVDIPSNPDKTDFFVDMMLKGIKKEEPILLAEIPEVKKSETNQKIDTIKEEEKKDAKKDESQKEMPTKEQKTKNIEKKRDIEKTTLAAVAKPVAKPTAKVQFKTIATSTATTITTYSVQLLAVKQPVDINYINKLDSVSVTIAPNGYYRYSIGNTSTVQESENILAKLKAKGIENAYVRINREHPGFTIQVMALSKPKKLSQFNDISGLMVYRGSDGLYRYCVGKYSTPEEAQDDLNKLATLGYGNAFLRVLGK